MTKGYTIKMNKYKKDPFRPQPHLRISPKSRRHWPIAQNAGLCLRASKCRNNRRCKACLPLHRLWEPKNA
jgi:hypothetical protein